MKMYYQGEYLGEVDGTKLSIIRIGYNQLQIMRALSQNPTEHLLQDIRVYEYILNNVNAEHLAQQYIKERDRNPKAKKIEIAKTLGWDVK